MWDFLFKFVKPITLLTSGIKAGVSYVPSKYRKLVVTVLIASGGIIYSCQQVPEEHKESVKNVVLELEKQPHYELEE